MARTRSVYKKSVLEPQGVIDVTALLQGESKINPTHIRIEQDEHVIFVSPEWGRSLAGVIAAAVAKLEEAQRSAAV